MGFYIVETILKAASFPLFSFLLLVIIGAGTAAIGGQHHTPAPQ